jgi:hypothetical protein
MIILSHITSQAHETKIRLEEQNKAILGSISKMQGIGSEFIQLFFDMT